MSHSSEVSPRSAFPYLVGFGVPAALTHGVEKDRGMSLREWYAGCALTAVCNPDMLANAADDKQARMNIRHAAALSVRLADALLAALEVA
jgi:hypothetical protein